MKEKVGENEVFLIIDGNAIVHRAYHALPPLTTSDGIATGAVFGFFSMLLKLFQELRPHYLAVTFDRPAPTFRKTLYVGYQAQRPHMEDGLSEQMKILHEILENSGISIFEVDGFEADDVIGTLAFRAKFLQNQKPKTKDQRPIKVIIVSGDRDMLQLVHDDIYVLAPIIGISQMKLFDEKAVKEKYELTPCQIIDYKALSGDASDNYPGIPGIGPKTAISLVKKYETVEKMYENISEIEKENPKLALKLAENQETALLAKKLATIITDVPLNFSINDCVFSRIDKSEMKKGFEKYSLWSMVKRLDDAFSKEEDPTKKKVNQMKLI